MNSTNIFTSKGEDFDNLGLSLALFPPACIKFSDPLSQIRASGMIFSGSFKLFIEPGSPWENGYIESFNGKMRDELLAREIFHTLKEAQVMIEMWRREYNTIRPHSALGYRPPAPEAILFHPTQFQQVGLT